MIYRVVAADFSDEELRKLARRMKRRQARHPSFGGAFCTAGIAMDVPLPKKNLDHPRARFWFTEKGWKRSRQIMLTDMKERGVPFKVLCQKNPKRSQIVYQDEFQVAILPLKG
mgnify:CR=1 FL=1